MRWIHRISQSLRLKLVWSFAIEETTIRLFLPKPGSFFISEWISILVPWAILKCVIGFKNWYLVWMTNPSIQPKTQVQWVNLLLRLISKIQLKNASIAQSMEKSVASYRNSAENRYYSYNMSHIYDSEILQISF